MSQFAFLQREWPEVFDAAVRAEAAIYADPRTACFYARRALELAMAWAYKHDAAHYPSRRLRPNRPPSRTALRPPQRT